MEDTLRKLNNAGFLIVEGSNQTTVSKLATNNDPRTLPTAIFKDYQAASSWAEERRLEYSSGKPHEFSAIVRYNRGLGIEYLNLETVFALTIEEAKIIALAEAAKVLGPKAEIREIKFRPKLK